MSHACLLTLCGLPAAGKTTFVKHFLRYVTDRHSGCQQSYCVVFVEYDDLIPADVQVSLQTPYQSEISEWKMYRMAILQYVDHLLKTFCTSCSPVQCDEGSVDDLPQLPAIIKEKFDCLTKQLSRCMSQEPVIIVFDDNMYYESMRYQVYQLARKYSASYAQLYFPVTLREALERNSQRPSPVPDGIIMSMAERFNVPLATNTWEQFTANWTREDDRSDNYDKVVALIEEALRSPVLPSDDNHEAQESRVVCSTNIIHQSDCILRRLVTDYLTASKANLSSSQQLSQLAKTANSLRQSILQEMRSQQLLVPQTAADGLNCSETCELHGFVHSLFMQRLNSVLQ